jgi:hypothetical protein
MLCRACSELNGSIWTGLLYFLIYNWVLPLQRCCAPHVMCDRSTMQPSPAAAPSSPPSHATAVRLLVHLPGTSVLGGCWRPAERHLPAAGLPA